MDETQYRIRVEFFKDNQWQDEYISSPSTEEGEVIRSAHDRVSEWVECNFDLSRPTFYTVRVNPQFFEPGSDVWESM